MATLGATGPVQPRGSWLLVKSFFSLFLEIFTLRICDLIKKKFKRNVSKVKTILLYLFHAKDTAHLLVLIYNVTVTIGASKAR